MLQKYRKLKLLNKILFSLCHSLCLLKLMLHVAFLRVFPFLGHSTLRILNVASDHSCRVQFSFSGLIMVFSKFSQLDITACIKSCVYNNFNLRYFMSSIIERLQKSFSFINSSVQIQLELEILGNSSTIFRSSLRRYSIKKLFLKIFVIFTGKHLCCGLFLIKVAGLLKASNCIKKGLQHRYFLVNIGKFIRTPILKKICERLLLHFWKLFCKNLLQIITQQRELLMKQK